MKELKGMPPLGEAPSDAVAPEVKPLEVGIEVVAIMDGHIDCSRKKPGDKFRVSSESKLGSWMECVDKDMQEKHLVNMQKLKLTKRQSAGITPAK